MVNFDEQNDYLLVWGANVVWNCGCTSKLSIGFRKEEISGFTKANTPQTTH